jgi:hypothetical protein
MKPENRRVFNAHHTKQPGFDIIRRDTPDIFNGENFHEISGILLSRIKYGRK